MEMGWGKHVTTAVKTITTYARRLKMATVQLIRKSAANLCNTERVTQAN